MPDPVRIIPVRHNEGEVMGLKERAAEFFAREKVRRAGRVLLVIAVLAVFLAAVGLSAYAILAYAPLKLTIDLGAEEQTLGGFGASSAWIYQRLGEPGYEQSAAKAIDLLYGDDGLGLGIFRYNIGGGSADASLDGVWPYNDSNFDVNRRAESFFVAENYESPESFADESNYDFGRDAAVRGLFESALATGNVTKVVFFVNSPHYLMTESGVCIGREEYQNNLKPEFYGAFCDYLLLIVQKLCEMYIDPLPVRPAVYVSPVNEPQWKWGGEEVSQEGCHYDADTLAAFYDVFFDKLAAFNAENGTDFEADVFESGCYEFHPSGEDIKDYLREMSKYDYFDEIDEISVHTYHTDDALGKRRRFARFMEKNYPGIAVAATEFCEMESGEFDTIESGMFLAKVVIRDLTMINAVDWSWWLSVAAGGYNDGLVYWPAATEGGEDEVYVLKRYYTFGQLTRFISAGDTRLFTKSSDPAGWAGVDAVAVRKPSGEVVVVVVNDGAAKSLTVSGLEEFAGAQVAVTTTTASKNWAESTLTFGGELPLEKDSVTTFVFG